MYEQKIDLPHSLCGALLVDKPEGISSFDVIRQIRRLYNTKKVGHCGTLDPFASGVMVLLFGEATKIAAYLTEEDKRYQGIFKLGITTDTGDREGQTTKQILADHCTLLQVQEVAHSLIGKMDQQPPRYSAQKINGQRAYVLARQGRDFETRARTIEVFKLGILQALGHQQYGFECHVSKGTYVRTLIEAIGERLLVGAHVISLRRIASGNLGIERTHTLESLQNKTKEQRFNAIEPVYSIWGNNPSIVLDEDSQKQIRLGRAVIAPKNASVQAHDPVVLAFDGNQNPVALGFWQPHAASDTYLFQPQRVFK